MTFKNNKLMQFWLKQDKKSLISTGLWAVFIIIIILLVGLLWGLTEVDWVQGSSFSYNTPTYKNVKSQYGSIPIYPTTMTIGIVLAIVFSTYSFYRKGLDINHLSIAVLVCVPSSLFLASFFGKLNATPGNEPSFFGLFAFWKEGMSIHGGVIGGVGTGVPIFYFIGRKARVSTLVYADAIIPNILLGQAIGRWGNFYNHEVMGAPVKALTNGAWTYGDWDSVASSGLALPKWITNNTTLISSGSITIDGQEYPPGTLIQMQPIFFYESLALFFAWLIILFIVPNITKWISKKPWHVDPTKYSYDVKFSIKQFFFPWLKSSGTTKSYRDVWNEAYYRSEANQKTTYLSAPKAKNRFLEASRISKANNLYEYSSTKAGVSGFAFFFAWNLVRFILELQRPDDHLFIMFNKPLSLSLILLTAFAGLLGMFACQYIFPKYLRKNGWLYEKEYFTI